jgi:hypothetical protein
MYFAESMLLLLLFTSFASPANEKLQINFMDVGQSDGAVLISPLGEVVLFDNGVAKYCDMTQTAAHTAEQYFGPAHSR